MYLFVSSPIEWCDYQRIDLNTPEGILFAQYYPPMFRLWLTGWRNKKRAKEETATQKCFYSHLVMAAIHHQSKKKSNNQDALAIVC